MAMSTDDITAAKALKWGADDASTSGTIFNQIAKATKGADVRKAIYGGMYQAQEIANEADAAKSKAQAWAEHSELYAADAKQSATDSAQDYEVEEARAILAEQALANGKVNLPTGSYSKYGTSGQVLRTLGDGTTEWATVGSPTDVQAEKYIKEWMDAHPEKTVTVEDHSLTYEKLVNGTLEYVTPEMYGAVGDGATNDLEALQAAIDSGYPVVGMLGKTYYLEGSYDGTTLTAITVSGDLKLINMHIKTSGTFISGKTSKALFNFTNQKATYNVLLENCEFDGNGETDSLLYVDDGDSSEFGDIFIVRCYIHKYTRRGISILVPAERLSIKNVSVDTIGGDEVESAYPFSFGRDVYNEKTGKRDRYNIINIAVVDGLRVETVKCVSMTDTSAHDNANGIFIAANYASVTNSYFNDISSNAIYLKSNYINIVGNTILDSGLNSNGAISVKNCYVGGVVQGNVVIGDGCCAYLRCLNYDFTNSGCERLIISDNYFRNKGVKETIKEVTGDPSKGYTKIDPYPYFVSNNVAVTIGNADFVNNIVIADYYHKYRETSNSDYALEVIYGDAVIKNCRFIGRGLHAGYNCTGIDVYDSNVSTTHTRNFDDYNSDKEEYTVAVEYTVYSALLNMGVTLWNWIHFHGCDLLFGRMANSSKTNPVRFAFENCTLASKTVPTGYYFFKFKGCVVRIPRFSQCAVIAEDTIFDGAIVGETTYGGDTTTTTYTFSREQVEAAKDSAGHVIALTQTAKSRIETTVTEIDGVFTTITDTVANVIKETTVNTTGTEAEPIHTIVTSYGIARRESSKSEAGSAESKTVEIVETETSIYPEYVPDDGTKEYTQTIVTTPISTTVLSASATGYTPDYFHYFTDILDLRNCTVKCTGGYLFRISGSSTSSTMSGQRIRIIGCKLIGLKALQYLTVKNYLTELTVMDSTIPADDTTFTYTTAMLTNISGNDEVSAGNLSTMLLEPIEETI